MAGEDRVGCFASRVFPENGKAPIGRLLFWTETRAKADQALVRISLAGNFMKVKDFIERLSTLDPEADVLVPSSRGIRISYPWGPPVLIDAYRPYVVDDRMLSRPADEQSKGIFIL